ncbi:hypothetical protein PCH_Pc21g19400 [Penicillium rubens Wisconsin 54-1255]|uniref:Uncharacterized protein n=1 Tax=Penicillium rubens (strain ATCC 28089 / DSM 1075 / NRRL 1951 / Wisconsin 54-1255) TaxID=500485 RepID=B6HJ52_PENRW|nr:hypothetical protein PCH_Pc21g19400 [Penicillium rubens Wisconsin 54-1255]
MTLGPQNLPLTFKQSRIGIRRMRVAPDLEMGHGKKSKWKDLLKKQNQSAGESNQAAGITGALESAWPGVALKKRACIASATDGLRASSQVAGHHASAEDPSRCDGASERRTQELNERTREGLHIHMAKRTHELGGTQIRGAEKCLGCSLIGGLTRYKQTEAEGEAEAKANCLQAEEGKDVSWGLDVRC